MESLPLPPRPNFEHYQKRAKDLRQSREVRKACSAVHAWVSGLARLTSLKPSASPSTTACDRHSTRQSSGSRSAFARGRRRSRRERRLHVGRRAILIASAHGFVNPGAFREASRRGRFQETRAAESSRPRSTPVVTGDMANARAPSFDNTPISFGLTRRAEHRATLASLRRGQRSRDYRQRTPKNAVDVARFLLESGADGRRISKYVWE